LLLSPPSLYALRSQVSGIVTNRRPQTAGLLKCASSSPETPAGSYSAPKVSTMLGIGACN